MAEEEDHTVTVTLYESCTSLGLLEETEKSEEHHVSPKDEEDEESTVVAMNASAVGLFDLEQEAAPLEEESAPVTATEESQPPDTDEPQEEEEPLDVVSYSRLTTGCSRVDRDLSIWIDRTTHTYSANE